MKWINPQDFGARGDWNTHDDDAWDRMMATLPPWEPARIYIPTGDYVFVRPWKLTRQLIVEGDGCTPQSRGTRLWFFGCDGIVVPPGNDNNDPDRGSYSQIRNLGLIGHLGDGGRYAGVRMFSNVSIEHCFVESWSSTGIVISADVTDTPPSSASMWSVRECQIQNCLGHGIGIAGGDVNVGVTDHVTVSDNAGFGIVDNSFLGCTHIADHAEHNDLGPYYAAGTQARNVFIGCYSESDQQPSYFRSPSVVVGGLHAAGLSPDSNPGLFDHDGSRADIGYPQFVGYSYPDNDMTIEPPFPARGLCIPYTTEAERVAAVAKIAAASRPAAHTTTTQ